MLKIRNFLLLLFACAAILPLGTFWYWTEHTTATNTAQNVEEKHLVQARLLKASLTRYRNDLTEALLAHLLDSSRLADNSVSSLQKGFGFRTVCVVNSDFSLVSIGTAIGFNCPAKIEDPVIQQRVAAVSDQIVEFLPMTKSTDGQLQLAVITQVRGFPIYATISTQIFTHLGSSVSFGESAHALITDQAGNLLFHPDTDYLNAQNVFLPFDKQQHLIGKPFDGIVQYSDNAGNDMIAGYAVDPGRWAVYITQPHAEVTALARQNRNGAVIIASFCLVIVLVLGVIFVREISNPIETIIRVANNVDKNSGKKRLEVSTNWRTPLEIREMQTHFNSMMDKLSASLNEVRRIAYTDLVTEGMNRQAFTRKTDNAMKVATHEGTPMVFLYVDLDDFKGVNDTYGHEAGDVYLKTIYNRMERSLSAMVSGHTLREGGFTALKEELFQDGGEKPIIARIGGDEFAGFFPFDGNDRILTAALHEFQNSISEPICLGDDKVGVGTSIGIARLPAEGTSQAKLSKNADMAMYNAKKSGKNRFVIYDKTLSEEDVQSEVISIDEALDQGQFSISYSPNVRSFDHKLCGVQAEIVWQHPQKGRLDASFFETMNFPARGQVKLSEWAFEQIFKDVKRSKTLNNIDKVTLAVPSRLIANKDFIPQFLKTLDKHHLVTKRFELEIMEEALSHQISLGSPFVSLLKNSGLGLSVKKSPKANSALIDIDKVDFDTLKFDRDMIKRIDEDYRAKVVMESLIDATHLLGIQTSVEGVDDRATFDALKSIGCQSFQGKWINASLSLEELEQWSINENKISGKRASLAPKESDIKLFSRKTANTLEKKNLV